MCFLPKKHLLLSQQISYRFGGYPPPPFADKLSCEEGVTDLGVPPPPPFTGKIRKVVFDVFHQKMITLLKLFANIALAVSNILLSGTEDQCANRMLTFNNFKHPTKTVLIIENILHFFVFVFFYDSLYNYVHNTNHLHTEWFYNVNQRF